jgi:biofilm PGA synthesis N-glycosyltransferase PgaC
MTPLPTFVLITPARNESQFIGLTLKSVVNQSVRPLKWIIVSDGSTDGTDDIVRQYAADHPWVELLRMPERKERDFAGKVRAFNAGYGTLSDLDYQVIASLDADVSFEEDYFAFLLEKLAQDQSLGLVGTPFKEESNSTYDYRFVNIEHVSGACQVFRRRCFEEIGGYIPVRGGCIDHIAVLSARMHGWRTRTFTDRICIHHRTMGTAERGLLMSRFNNGLKDYSIGNHPLWELSRTIYQMTRKPYVVGGLAVLTGYIWSLICRPDRPVSKDLVAFQRGEQMQRLRQFFLRKRFLERQLS